MATYIEMPQLADTMTSGVINRWLIKEGDTVAFGQVIAEVQTDKAAMEMSSFEDGTVFKLLQPEGASVPIGTKIAMVLSKGETAPADGQMPAASGGSAQPALVRETPAATAATPNAPAAVAHAAPAAAAVPGARIKASPLAKKVAAEKGVDLSVLTGTGPGGRIVRKDVDTAPVRSATASAPAKAATPSAAPQAVPSTPAGPGDLTIALSPMRRIIADRLLASKQQLPHFYLHIEVDAGPMAQLRTTLNAASESAGGPKITFNDFVLRAVALAAAKVPQVNASFAGDSIIQYGSVHLAVAVAIDDGLITPVIRDCQKKSLKEVSEAVKDLATRARNKKLKPDEFQGGTITVSNLGSYGIESFSAIINPPQAMIIAVGSIVKKPVVGPNDQIVVGQRLSIGLSADHRVVDGAVAAQYLAEFRRLIENPALLLF